MKNMTETLMLWRPVKKNASSLSLWLLGVKLPLLPQNLEIIGKKGGLTTVVGFSECTRPRGGPAECLVRGPLHLLQQVHC